MLKSITASNFLSWDQLKFYIPNGIVLIEGWNEDDQTSEGSGKSAIFNALCWGIYGKIPKDVKIDDVIKTGKKSCAVILKFDKFEIVRTRKPNELFIVLNGEQKKGKDAKETQTMIEELVGMSYAAFCQTSYFSQNSNNNFLLSNQEDRAKILSEIQDLNAFDKARSLAHNKLKVVLDSIDGLKYEIQNHKVDIDRIEERIEHKKNLNKQEKDFLKEKINVAEDSIEYNNSKIAQIDLDIKSSDKFDPALAKTLKEELNKINEQIFGLKAAKNNLSSDMKAKIRTLTEKLDHATKNKGFVEKDIRVLTKKEQGLKEILNPNSVQNCQACGQELKNVDTSLVKKQLKEVNAELNNENLRLKEYTEALNTLKEEYKKVSSNTSQDDAKDEIDLDINKCQKAFNAVVEKLDVLENQKVKEAESKAKRAVIVGNLNSQKEYLEKLMLQEVTDITDYLNEQGDKIASLKDQVEARRSLLKDKSTEAGRLDTLKHSFREIKTFVFNSILDEINLRANKYLETLFEVPVTLNLRNEDMKIEASVEYNNEERSLGLLSGGQFRRLSLATDLALSDIVCLRKNNKIGVMIFDEYCKDLSESSMEKCLELFRTRSVPVLMIEHNSMLKSIIDETYTIVLQNGTSRARI